MRSIFITVFLCALISSSSFANIDNGLVIYFSFDKIDGRTVINEANPHLNGTLEAGAEIIAGYKNNGVGLNMDAGEATPGTDFIRVGNVPEVNVEKAFTLALWAKGTNFGTYRTLMSKTDSGAYALTVENGFPTTWIHVAGDYLLLSGKTNIVPDKWYHFASTFDGNEGVIYIDGVEDARASRKGNITVCAADFMIGGEPAGTALDPAYPAWHGILDEFYFYDRALSENEINQLIKQASPVDALQKLPLKWGEIKQR